jgi:hypothetical protein
MESGEVITRRNIRLNLGPVMRLPFIYYMLNSWENAPYARWMPHNSVDGCHITL